VKNALALTAILAFIAAIAPTPGSTDEIMSLVSHP